MELYFYYASKDYIDFLKNAERAEHSSTRVPDVDYTHKQKFLYGAVLTIDGMNYYVPVSSYSKPQQDLILIKDKAGAVKGSLRFSYMIPIPQECLQKLDINQFESADYRVKVSKELAFVRRNRDKIFKKAKSTYNAVISKRKYDPNYCDFKLLESAFIAYCREHDLTVPAAYLETHPELFSFQGEA